MTSGILDASGDADTSADALAAALGLAAALAAALAEAVTVMVPAVSVFVAFLAYLVFGRTTFAVIFAVPAATAVTVPSAATVAAAVLSEA